MNTDPKQALEEYMGEQFIEWLIHYIPQVMENWPIMTRIKSVQAKPEKLKKLILQIFLINEAFLGGREGDPGFLRFAIANLSESDDPLAENALEILEKRRTEELIGHKLERGMTQTVTRMGWIKLLKALGMTEEEIDRAEPKEHTRNFIAELSDLYSTSEWQTAVGAFVAQEVSEIEESKAILSMLKKQTSLTDKDLQVLENRVGSADQQITTSSRTLDKVAFDQEAKELVWQGVERLLQIRQEFLEGLEKYLED